jgi:hypothetical protein
MHQLFAIDAGRGYRKWQTSVAIIEIAVVVKAISRYQTDDPAIIRAGKLQDMASIEPCLVRSVSCLRAGFAGQVR